MSITFPAHAAFPKWQEGRHPHCHFRGLLRLHSHYGPSDRSAAQRRPLSRGSNPCGCPHEPLISYRINRQFSGWNLPPLMIRVFGAHCQEQTCRLIQLLDGSATASTAEDLFSNRPNCRIKPFGVGTTKVAGSTAQLTCLLGKP